MEGVLRMIEFLNAGIEVAVRVAVIMGFLTIITIAMFAITSMAKGIVDMIKKGK